MASFQCLLSNTRFLSKHPGAPAIDMNMHRTVVYFLIKNLEYMQPKFLLRTPKALNYSDIQDVNSVLTCILATISKLLCTFWSVNYSSYVSFGLLANFECWHLLFVYCAIFSWFTSLSRELIFVWSYVFLLCTVWVRCYDGNDTRSLSKMG